MTREEIIALIRERAGTYGIPPELALGLAKQESGFNPGALSPAGAIGVMQLMPGTARGLGVNPHDVNQNIDGGLRYLKEQIDKFGVPMGLAAYNAGPGNVQKHLATGRPLPAETQKYIPAVLANANMPMSNVPQIPGSAPILPPTFTPPASPAPSGPTMMAQSQQQSGGLGSLGSLAQLFGAIGGGGGGPQQVAQAPPPQATPPPIMPSPAALQAIAQMLQNPSYERAPQRRSFYS